MTPGEAVPALIAYARTSTADQQNPEESLRWQLDIANTLIAGRAKIVGVVHDKGTSRSLPWSQRKEASALLAQLPNPSRGWSGIVVGEPQRAFGDTGQVQTVLAQLNHYDVQLWVPELQGPVDPASEIHDIILSLFGGLSRAERNRLRVRVRTSMRAMAPEGRAGSNRSPPPEPGKGPPGRPAHEARRRPFDLRGRKDNLRVANRRAGMSRHRLALTGAGAPCPSGADPKGNPTVSAEPGL